VTLYGIRRTNIAVGTQGPRGPIGPQGEQGLQGDPGDFALDDFNVYKDISDQMSHTLGKDTFNVGEQFVHLRVHYNGRIQTHAITAIDNILFTFTLDFIPKATANKKLEIYYDKP